MMTRSTLIAGIDTNHAAWLRSAARFGVLFGTLARSFSTLAVGAKHVMTSVPDFLVIDFAVVLPLIALVWRDTV